MLWLVLKYYGITFNIIFLFTILILMFVNMFYYGSVSERLVREYRDEFASTGRWPVLKKKNNLPAPLRRKYKIVTRVYFLGQFGLMALLFGVGALAMHFKW